ncbi:SUMF1/EgtB/PvdO family nonheme iron enzyme [Nitrospina sp. 32_T5]|uniref:formylglycine-generating enzyme family protein n=1 Tax=unclassified Nitrospina TaxID=2638683 RepID=UPI003F962F2D
MNGERTLKLGLTCMAVAVAVTGFVGLVTPETSRAQESMQIPTGMVMVPGGPFVMGVDREPHSPKPNMSAAQKLKYRVSREAFHDEGPAHQVILDPYYLDKYEVSNRQYADFLKATGHPAPAYWDDHKRNKPDQPVSGVNWHDADTFCRWSNKRLPTEAEWENAARGPEGFKYPWGNDLDASKANFGRKKEFTANVDHYPEGKSPYGAYNMAGNVFEWVADWYDPHYYKSKNNMMNPSGPVEAVMLGSTGTYVDRLTTGKKKVIRGGSWYAPAESTTTTHRFWNDPMNNSYGVGLGFRCARSVETEGVMQARTFYMEALIHMGAEKYGEAMQSISRAIKLDPQNEEYRTLEGMIKKQVN